MTVVRTAPGKVVVVVDLAAGGAHPSPSSCAALFALPLDSYIALRALAGMPPAPGTCKSCHSLGGLPLAHSGSAGLVTGSLR